MSETHDMIITYTATAPNAAMAKALLDDMMYEHMPEPKYETEQEYVPRIPGTNFPMMIRYHIFTT
jgi:hypothetical protein